MVGEGGESVMGGGSVLVGMTGMLHLLTLNESRSSSVNILLDVSTLP